MTQELKKVKAFEIVRIMSTFRKGFILYNELFDRSAHVESPDHLIVKDGLDSCSFIGRKFLHELAEEAGAGSENQGWDKTHAFFSNKTPIRKRR